MEGKINTKVHYQTRSTHSLGYRIEAAEMEQDRTGLFCR